MKGSCKTVVTYPDDGTQEITRQAADAAEEILGGRPHVVLLHLHRHGNKRSRYKISLCDLLSTDNDQ